MKHARETLVSSGKLNTGMTMAEIMGCLPGGKRALFAKYHLGGCSSCAFSDEETLADLCSRSGLVAEEVLMHLLASHEHDKAMWISPLEVSKSQGDFLWIDMRTREEFEGVPLAGASFSNQELQQTLFAEPPEKPILLFDHSGQDVLDHVAWFRGHGLDQTFGLLGGIDQWAAEIDSSIRRYRLEFDR